MQSTRIVSVLLLILGAAFGLIFSAGSASAGEAQNPPSTLVEIAEPLVIEREVAPSTDGLGDPALDLPDARPTPDSTLPSADAPVATAPLEDGGRATVRLGSVLLLVGALVVGAAGRRRWA